MERSEQAHRVAYGRVLLDGPNNEGGDGRVRQEVLSLEDVVEIMLH